MEKLIFSLVLLLTTKIIYLITGRNRRQIARIPKGMAILCQPPGQRYVAYAIGVFQLLFVAFFLVLYIKDGAPAEARLDGAAKGENDMHKDNTAQAKPKKDEREEVLKEIRQLENRQKILENKQRNEERKARTRRLIERGAILEGIFPLAPDLPGVEVKAFLIALSHLPGAAELAAKLPKSGDKP